VPSISSKWRVAEISFFENLITGNGNVKNCLYAHILVKIDRFTGINFEVKKSKVKVTRNANAKIVFVHKMIRALMTTSPNTSPEYNFLIFVFLENLFFQIVKTERPFAI